MSSVNRIIAYVITSGLVIMGAHALTRPANQRLLLILLDGFRHDYLSQRDLPLPGFQKIAQNGVKPEALIPDFPTLSYPNYYSIMTGLHTESHGMTGNFMFDVKSMAAFLIGQNPGRYNAHWWDGGDPLWTTAVRQNKKVYMRYWPGCDVWIHGLQPTQCAPYVGGGPTMGDFTLALNESLALLKSGQADVAAVYFEKADDAGQNYGPLSPELKRVLLDLDPVMSDLADSMTSDPALSDINLMVFSDHGMTEINITRVINLNKVLDRADYVIIMEAGAVSCIYTPPGTEEQVYAKLENFHPHMKVYRQRDLPDRWHYKRGKYVAPLTAVADQGWFIIHPFAGYPHSSSGLQPYRGLHGYDNLCTDMHAIFLGMGPAFKTNVTSKPIHAVDLYQVMCNILGIHASPNNGTAARVAPLLADGGLTDAKDDDQKKTTA